ncbi:ABC transporter substrate-binding protein [Haloactinomyces albus]|uniref:Branched-chain amino acid transport system substrate-binding protein n=1 Tax=Haloactinomyces albus TaxID=1352928 RepID=A0AAE3ZHV1_9ACTN|nr:ABC transporter substrate-binding protein [Haloactinomyces albus]MDR7303950.1 branched-chain amino acid transport system substrate-binding protein [Haloactinomyces albus]
MKVRKRWWRTAAFAGAATLVVGLAGCGGSSGASNAGGGLPETVKIMSIKEMTGPVSFAGIHATRGIKLAVEQINQQDFLGETDLKIEVKDSAASAQKAASFTTQAIADESYAAILGPASSSQAAAMSPIAQKSRMPVIYTQAGSEGVLVGDYTYRLTPPASSYFGVAGDYLASKNIRTAAVLYNSGNPTLSELGKKTVPGLAEEHGFSMQSSNGVPRDALDFTAVGSEIAEAAPGAVFVLLEGPQNPRAISQLRRNGYQGEIVGMTSMGAGNLETAGETAAGAVWPGNFSALSKKPSVQKFVEAYKAEYDGEIPNNYAAEGYDAAWFLARGIEQAGSVSRTAIQDGLAGVAKAGFKGAQGELRFQGNDVRVEGVLAGWNGSKEVLVMPSGS